MDKGETVQEIVVGTHDAICLRADEQALVEREVARMSGDGLRMAASILGRIVAIEAERGPDVAEAVIDKVIDILRGERRMLS